MTLLAPMKRATNSDCGRVVDILRRAELVDPAGIHHRDQVGRRHRLGLVVGDVDRGVAVFVVQPADLETHLLAQIGVEVGERLVEQQRFRLDDQRARQRHALLLAARQFAGIALRQRFELGRRKDRRELFARWCRGRSSAAAGHRRCFRRPSCAATARSSGRSSTSCAVRAAACAPSRTPAGRRPGSRRRRAREIRRSAAASWSCRSRTGRAGRPVAVIDPQRDVIDHRKRRKALGQAAQFNGRQSVLSRYLFARRMIARGRCWE